MEFQYLSDSSRLNRQDNQTYSSGSSSNNTFPIQINPSNQNNLFQYHPFDHYNPPTGETSSSSSSVGVPRSTLVQPQNNLQTNLQQNNSSLSNTFNFPLNSNPNFSNSLPPPQNLKSNKSRRHYHQQQQQQQQEKDDSFLNYTDSSPLSLSNRNNYNNQIIMNKSRSARDTSLQNMNNDRQQQQQQQQQQNISTQQQVPPPQVQYRIFKRGDTIPGISTPLTLTSSSMNIQNNEMMNGTNSTNTMQQQQQIHQQLVQQQLLHQHLQHQQQQQQQQEIINCAEPVVGNVNNNSMNINNIQSSSLDIQNEGIISSNNSSTTTTTIVTKESDSVNAPQLQPPTSNADQNNKQITERGSNNRTPISIIGDIARFHGLNAEYRLTNETGPPHAPIFTVVLSIGNEQYQAQGNSIKKAQLAAAQIAVEKTSLARPPARPQPKRNHSTNNFHPKRTNWTIMQLNALAEELDEKLSFTSQPVPIMNPYGRTDPPSLVVVHVGEKVFSGEGTTFNAAKNMAAMSALKALLQIKHERELAKLENGTSLPDVELDTDGKSPISVCHEMALKRGLSISFEVKGEEGPPHLKVFTVECNVGEYTTIGTGPTKQQAKKATCEFMIQKLKEVPPKLPKATSISLKAMQKGLLKPKVSRKKPSTPVVKEVDKQIVSPISRLLQIAHVKKFREPEFSLVEKPPSEESEQPNVCGKSGGHRHRKKKPLFTMEVKIGPHICTGTGPNKKSAKKAAADAALVMLGYAPTESKEEVGSSSNGSGSDNDTINNKTNGTLPTTEAGEAANNNKNSSEVKLTAYRQLVPGVLVIKSEANGQNSSSPPTNMAQEMMKLNSIPNTTSKSLDGIGKLSYLAELLQVSVSYSDFPKKNEFLSVVSISTNPPHVAHGIGPSREEAQNSAALEILEELANTGLEST